MFESRREYGRMGKASARYAPGADDTENSSIAVLAISSNSSSSFFAVYPYVILSVDAAVNLS